ARTVHGAGSDARGSTGADREGARRDAGQLRDARAAVQPGAGRVQAVSQLPAQARLPSAGRAVPPRRDPPSRQGAGIRARSSRLTNHEPRTTNDTGLSTPGVHFEVRILL